MVIRAFSKTTQEALAKAGKNVHDLNRALSDSGKEAKRAGTDFATLTGNVLKAAPAFAVATAAISGVYGTFRLLGAEIRRGFTVVEEYKQNMISMAAVVSSFSEKAQQGDIAGAFKEAVEYSGQLVEKLELIDAKSLLAGNQLIMMADTLAKNKLLIRDLGDKEEIEGFLRLSNALALMTAGSPNQDLQIVQEMRALAKGEFKPGNVVANYLRELDPMIETHIKQWREAGTFFENIGKLVPTIGVASKDLEGTWGAIKSTLVTINDRVLRGAFHPAVEQILDWVEQISAKLMNKDGSLTQFAIDIQDNIKGALDSVLKMAETLGKIAFSDEFKTVIKDIGIVIGLLGLKGGAGLLKRLGSVATSNPITATVAGTYFTTDYLTEQLKKTGQFAPVKTGEYGGQAVSTLGGAAPAQVRTSSMIWDLPLSSVHQQLGFQKTDMSKVKWDSFSAHSKGATAPKLIAGLPDEDELKAAKKLADDWAKELKKLSADMDTIGMDKYAKELYSLSAAADEMREKFGNRKEIDAWLATMTQVVKMEEDLDKYTDSLERFYSLTPDEEMDRIKDRLEEIEEAKKKAVDMVDVALSEDFRDLDAYEQELRDAAARTEQMWVSVGMTIEDSLTAALISGVNGFRELGEIASNMLREIAAQIVRSQIVKPIAKGFMPFLKDIGSSIFSRATGGPLFPGVPTLVGERGPELILPTGPGHVVPNNQLYGGQTEVHIHNYSNTQVSSAVTSRGGRRLDLRIDEMVAQAIGGGGQASRAVASTGALVGR